MRFSLSGSTKSVFCHTFSSEFSLNGSTKSVFVHTKKMLSVFVSQAPLHLKLLNFVLPMVCKRNIEFQAEEPKVHVLYTKMETLLKTIVSLYMNEDYVDQTDVEFLEFVEKTKDNEKNWEPLHRVDLGHVVTADLASLSSVLPINGINNFRTQCRQFLIVLGEQIYKRFPFKEKSVKVLKQLSFIDPVNLHETESIAEVADFFGIDVESAYIEFKQLKKMFSRDVKTDMAIFWEKVRTAKSADDSPEFKLILDIVDRVFVLPH